MTNGFNTTNPDPDGCQKRVPNDVGSGFHWCTRKAVEDGLCRQHHNQRTPQPFQPKNHTEAASHEASGSARIRLAWEHGKGPLIKARWVRTPFFVRFLEISVYTSIDSSLLRADGYLAKRNGQPSQKGITNVTVYLDDFPEKTREVVQSAIDAARDLLPRIDR